MKYFTLLMGLLCEVALPLYAQGWTPQDSLHVRRLLETDGEMNLNPKALKELETELFMGAPKMDMHKSWMDFDTSLPALLQEPKETIRLTLRPYTATTKYNWDPVYQKKINIDKDTWRGDPFYNMTAGWKKEPNPSKGMDLLAIFTRDFWDVKGRARRARTLEVLRGYGDSTTVLLQIPVYPR